MSCLIVIPARWHSTRLPGKPLIALAGRPLLTHVIDIAKAAASDLDRVELVVATDDDRIRDVAERADCRVVMTAAELSSGSARALAAALTMTPPPALVVNLQGDAPFTPVAAIARVVGALKAGARVATPVRPLSWAELDALRRHKRRTPFSGTTCVVAPDDTALWFSKQIIPAIRGEADLRRSSPLSPVNQHIGLYGYALEALIRFEGAPPGANETLEGLEQLRFFDLGIPIRVVRLDQGGIVNGGIDTIEDLRRAERLLHRAASSRR